MIRGDFGRITILAMTLLWASSAWARPLCESETGERVRAGIFDADFGYNLAVILLPFPLFFGITYLIHSGPPWSKVVWGGSRPTAWKTPKTLDLTGEDRS